MARQLPPPRGGRAAQAMRMARRATPLALEAYRRWDQLTPEQKKRYAKMAREYAGRGRVALERAQRGRGGGRR
ncbi:MAG: hypothetical protein QOE08_51 [Thermoleophilaceae bacterium]|jgi:hypothetical protein|nr:hypothetical protein [Thermoleophilaceae bacterium]